MTKSYTHKLYCSKDFYEFVQGRFTEEIYKTYPELQDMDLSVGKKLDIMKKVILRYAL